MSVCAPRERRSDIRTQFIALQCAYAVCIDALDQLHENRYINKRSTDGKSV